MNIKTINKKHQQDNKLPRSKLRGILNFEKRSKLRGIKPRGIKKDFEKAISLLAQNKINTGTLISRYFDLDRISEAYKYADEKAREAMKILLKNN